MGRFDETVCHCALNRIFGFEPKAALTIIDALGSASEVFEMSRSELDAMLGPFNKYKSQICTEALGKAEAELETLERAGCRFIAICDKDFPALLRDCEDPPVGIYYKGISAPGEIFNGRDFIAVVGTRDISPYGTQWCEKITRGISQCGENPTIVSGLAIGTDICAHRTALGNGVPTIAVMATGIDDIYPWRHRADAERMASTRGCALVTDFPPGTSPVGANFLRRNRIIAGMSRATILIESKLKGGGMMTANLAFSYGREVYALPGRVDDSRSQGCNELIRRKVAEAITTVADIGSSLGMDMRKPLKKKALAETLGQMYGDMLEAGQMSTAIRLAETIRKNRAITVEDLSLACGTRFQETAEIVAMLEADGIISTDLLQRCCICGDYLK